MTSIVAAVSTGPRSDLGAWARVALRRAEAVAPDGSAVRAEGLCVLGQATLRTAKSDAVAPETLDGQCWAVADARLDDRRSLERELSARGRRAGPLTSDAALVLHAYDLWGERCTEHLAGDFAFAVWDGRRQRLFCGRDQIGVVPLHYAAIGNALLVATDIGSLLDHPEVDDSLDEEAIADFLVAGRPRDPAATTFAGIRRVPPAHVLSWAAGEVHCRRYWALAREPLVRFRHPEDYSRAFRDLLDVAVAERLTADKVAVHLTGGMDSTSVAASARLEMTKRGAAPSAIRAVTAVLGGDSGDREGEFASLAAAALGLDVDWVDGSSLPRLAPWATPVVPPVEPTPYQRTTYQFELVRVPSLHARVALSGMAGDCLLWSSPLYWAEWLRHGEVGRLATALVDEVRISHHRPYPGVRAALKRHRVLKAVGSEAVPGWLAHDLATRVNATERMPRSVLPASAMDARAIALETTWPTWFIWSHPSYTGVPVRVRYPLVDLRLVRYALSLPPRPWLVDKRVLRDASSPRLPREITERPKTPLVAAPLPGLDAAALQELAAFVQEVPDLERFVNVKELVAALEVPASAIGHRQEMALAQPLGLAHWLSHRRITRASLDGRLPSAIPFSQEQVGP